MTVRGRRKPAQAQVGDVLEGRRLRRVVGHRIEVAQQIVDKSRGMQGLDDEAGSYGAHVRGLNRVHQFDKVEIVRIEKPENSYAVLEEMVEHVKGLLRALELPYRQLLLCGGDMGFASAMTYDMEVYSAAQHRWLEVSSISNFETFQSNRMKLRYRGEDKKPRLAHTLNGSALALARIVAALLENNQTPDGIRIPKVLQPYMGMAMITK